MSLKESVVEGAALERFEARRCEFKEAANNFSSALATLRDTRYVPPQRVAQDVTERQQRVLAMLSESGAGLALREVHARLGEGITERQARKDLEALRILGLAQATGHGRGSRWSLS